ncbi:MAG: ATPase domain-containing protein [Candidatus Micrarchaeia archaeon]
MVIRAGIAPFGIEGLDYMLGGGLPKGSVVLVSGGTGSGKSILASQFLYKGITDYKESGFYISFDERKRSMYRNLAKFGWNFSAYEAQKKFIFIEYPIHEAKEFLSQENTLFNLIVELEIERLVIDPITPLTMLYEDGQKKRQEMMKLIDTLRSWGTTTLLISEAKSGTEEIGIEPLCDGVIKLTDIQNKGYTIKTLEVVKMRGTDIIKKPVPYKIDKDGIKVYPNQYLYL